jgi:hypothetical protein
MPDVFASKSSIRGLEHKNMGHVEEKEFDREELLAELNDKAHKRTGMSFDH